MNRLVALFFASAVFTSCSIHKKIAVSSPSSASTVTSAAKPEVVSAAVVPKKDSAVVRTPDSAEARRNAIAALRPVFNHRTMFNSFSAKAKVVYEDGQDNSHEFTANIRVRKDSAIWVTVSALGGMVQAARILITPDTFRMINYIDREVVVLPAADAVKILPAKLDYSTLQNLIIGDPLRNSEITLAATTDSSWWFETRDNDYIQHVAFARPDSLMAVGTLDAVREGGANALVEYGDYEPVSEKKVATHRTVTITNAGKKFIFDLKFQSPLFDLQVDFPFNIPKNYGTK